jgi:putative membrane protein
MDPLSFTFLLYASYCLALLFLLPGTRPVDSSRLVSLVFDPTARTSRPVLGLASLLFTFIDMVIDPLALRGDRWFLGRLYYYADPGIHFGVPVANYVGWAIVGVISLTIYVSIDRRSPPLGPMDTGQRSVTGPVLLGCGIYYGVLAFNLAVAFWIDEPLLGVAGLLMYIPITTALLLRWWGVCRLRRPRGRRAEQKTVLSEE